MPAGLIGKPVRYADLMGGNAMRALVNSMGAATLFPRKARWLLLRMYGIDAEAWNIREHCFFGGTKISVGRGTLVNRGCVFDNLGSISIGTRCAIGMEVMFATSDHEMGGSDGRAGDPFGRPIVVEDGCWIGSRVVLLPGAVVGRGSIVGAGSVVTGQLDPDSVYVGSPARKIRSLID